MDQDPLFGRLTVEIHCHVTYHYRQGWTLWIASRLEGEPFPQGGGDRYGPCTLEEVIQLSDDVLTSAYLGTRYRT